MMKAKLGAQLQGSSQQRHLFLALSAAMSTQGIRTVAST